jgi:hypothetical protein
LERLERLEPAQLWHLGQEPTVACLGLPHMKSLLDLPSLRHSRVKTGHLEILFQQLDYVQDTQLPALKINPVGIGVF